MPIREAEFIWRDGEFVPWHDARVHVLSLAIQFGSSIFEGIRCYPTARGPAIFRLREHIRRLYDSCRIYRIEVPYKPEEIIEACRAVVRRNRLDMCYVRPMVLRGYGAAGMLPVDSPIETFVCAWPWGAYLGAEALAQGVDVCVSSWQRMQPNTFPAAAKAAGHYVNAQLIKMEAAANGYAEAIALGPGGLVSEGSGQNLFMVVDGALVTPLLDGTSLRGITRDSVIVIARELGLTLHERPVPRETLYTADELFFTGTATEVTPIRSVDRIPIGTGSTGPVTREVQARFNAIVRGERDAPGEWLTYVG
ncbi:MAG TPA: branched-chain amino acid transaminase [Gemmatimonadaceae bacterium]|nr:branched-chain amino acid transaminase [Gemmatimonadaceae bacterium]